MKTIAAVAVALAAALFDFASEAASPVLSSPADGVTLDTHFATRKTYLTSSKSKRSTQITWSGWLDFSEKTSQLLRFCPHTIQNHWGAAGQVTNVLSWAGTGPFTVTVSNISDSTVFFTTNGYNGTSLKLQNLMIAKKYRWTVSNGEGSVSRTFRTSDVAPRYLADPAGRVAGIRDLGGRRGFNGRRVRQGMIFRSSELNVSSATVEFRPDGLKAIGTSLVNHPSAKGFWKDELKIRYDLDLRTGNASSSPLNAVTGGTSYQRSTGVGPHFIDKGGDYSIALRNQFAVFTDSSKYPVIFHGVWGKDTTGVLSFFLLSALGCDDDEVRKDWEATYFWSSKLGYFTGTPGAAVNVYDYYEKAVKNCAGSTTSEKATNFLKTQCGVTQAQIDAFRNIMLEPTGQDDDEDDPQEDQPDQPGGIQGDPDPTKPAWQFRALETDGAGWILTDYTPNIAKTKIEIKARMMDLDSNHALYVANACTSGGGSATSQMALNVESLNTQLRYFNQPTDADKYTKLQCTAFDDVYIHTYTTFRDKISFDDLTGTIPSWTTEDKLASGPLELFAGNIGAPGHINKARVRVQSVKIWEISGSTTNLVRNYVAATNATGAATLYDTVHSRFCTVGGSDEFTVTNIQDPDAQEKNVNYWKTAPAFAPLSIIAGNQPTQFSIGVPAYGAPVATYSKAISIASLPAGTYTQTVAVAEGGIYTGISTSFVFTVTGTLPTAASIAPAIVAPVPGSRVPTHTALQKAFLAKSSAERRAAMKDASVRSPLAAGGCLPKPLTLEWTGNGICTVTVKREKDSKTVFSRQFIGNEIDIDQLEIGTRYVWTVQNSLGTATGRFTTEAEAPRLLRNPGNNDIYSIRDIGGRIGLDGKRVKQGLIFRSSEFCYKVKKSNGAKSESFITDANRSFWLNDLGIKTDLDFRSTEECGGWTSSPLGVTWVHAGIGSYTGLFNDIPTFTTAFNVFLNQANYPIDFHCVMGRDRTGCVAYLINAVLGVDEDELDKDWEANAFYDASTSWCHETYLDKFVSSLAAYGGSTRTQQAYNFLKNGCGYSAAQIESFRNFMLEEVESDPEPGWTLKYATENTIVCLGDSQTYGSGDTGTVDSRVNFFDGRLAGANVSLGYPYALAGLVPTNYNVVAQAWGGNRTANALCYAGFTNLVTHYDITIPASGSVKAADLLYLEGPNGYDIQIPNLPAFEGKTHLQSMTGFLGDLHVRYNYVGGQTWQTIERVNAGSAVTVPAGTQFKPDVGLVYSVADPVWIIFTGSNDGEAKYDEFSRSIRSAMEGRRYLFISSYHAFSAATLAKIDADFGTHHVPLKALLAADGYTEANMSEILSDNVHFNHTGYGLVAKYVANALRVNGYIADDHAHVWGAWQTVSAATCTTAGSRTHSCTADGCTTPVATETEPIPALGHDFGAWFTNTVPQVGVAGQLRRDCRRTGCGHYETQVIAPLPNPDEPAGSNYGELYEYFDNAGKGYFLTDYWPNHAKTTVEVQFRMNALSDISAFAFASRATATYAGVTPGANDYDWGLVYWAADDKKFQFYNEPTTNVKFAVMFDDTTYKHTVVFGGNTVTFDGEVFGGGAAAPNAQCSGPLMLLGNYFFGQISMKANARIYSIKVREGESLVADYVPATDKSGKATFYDRVADRCVTILGEAGYKVGNGLPPAPPAEPTGRWYGKRISILADSYSAYAGTPGCTNPFYPGTGDLTSVDEMWWKIVIDRFNGTLDQNCSMSASEISVGQIREDEGGQYIGSFLERARNGGLGSPDIIFMLGGLNDYWQGRPIDFFEEKLNDLYDVLDTEYASAEKYILLLHSDSSSCGCGLSGDYRGVLRRVAHERGYKVIDLQNCGATPDEFIIAHPKKAAQIKYANAIISVFEDGEPDMAEDTIVCLGDSLTVGVGDEGTIDSRANYFDGRLAGLSTYRGYPYLLSGMVPSVYSVIDQSVGSALTTNILAMAGFQQLRTASAVTVNANVATSVSELLRTPDGEKFRFPVHSAYESSLDSITGYIGEYHVRITRNRIEQIGGTASVTFPKGSLFVPDFATEYLNKDPVWVIFAGTNDRRANIAKFIPAIKAAVKGRRYVVVVPYSGYKTTDEAAFVSEFGNHCVCLRSRFQEMGFITAADDYRWSPYEENRWTSITTSDCVHLNEDGYRLVAKAVRDKLVELGYISGEMPAVAPFQEPAPSVRPAGEPEPAGDIQPMANAAWGYTVGGLGASGDETAYVFTNTTAAMNWTAPAGATTVQLLVVAGGGAGGGNNSFAGGAGGGAGGLRYETAYTVVPGESYSISVGAGGAATAGAKGANGGSSVFGTVTTTGGGAGGAASVGSAVGSGGGGAGIAGSTRNVGGAAVSGEGYAGGAGDGYAPMGIAVGGGGGGAGSAGMSAPNDETGGNGGAGVMYDISGVHYVYASGGAGGADSPGHTNGSASVGGGAGGANGFDASGYGGGGGGTSANMVSENYAGGNGYQGVVIIRCATAYVPPVEPPVVVDVVTNAMENPAWGYRIYGLGEAHNEVAYVFTNTTAAMSWTAPADVSNVRLLVVAGGGAGGNGGVSGGAVRGAGGGGAGGYRYESAWSVTAANVYSVSVGAGGDEANGGASAFGSVSVAGGGKGGSMSNGANGGCGGGGAGAHKVDNVYIGYVGGTGSSGQNGGDGFGYHGSSANGGGGGGAKTAGADTAGDEQGANGGEGETCSIVGSEIVYCSGGGGGSDSNPKFGVGGTGAGDGGANSAGCDATGYGCGGGGGSGDGNAGGRGFQGVVIIRYVTSEVPVQKEQPVIGGEGGAVIEVSGGEFRLRISNAHADYTYTCRWTDDLTTPEADWNVLQISPSDFEVIGGEAVLSLPTGSAPTRFYRITAE